MYKRQPIGLHYQSAQQQILPPNIPLSYATRIQRFHYPVESLDYFSIVYSVTETSTDPYLLALYEFLYGNDFPDWNHVKSNHAMWKYTNDADYKKRVDIWNQIYNPMSTYFGGFNFENAFGLAGNNINFYECSVLNNTPFFENSLNNYVFQVIYGQANIFPKRSWLKNLKNGKIQPITANENPSFLEKQAPKKIKVSSLNIQSNVKIDFYSHVSLTKKKKLPKNWRTLPSTLRVWFESDDLAPPPTTNTISTKYKSKQYKAPKSTIPNNSLWNSSSNFSGTSGLSSQTSAFSTAGTKMHN